MEEKVYIFFNDVGVGWVTDEKTANKINNIHFKDSLMKSYHQKKNTKPTSIFPLLSNKTPD
jgi:hypothetical protein